MKIFSRLKILEELAKLSQTTGDLISVLLSSPYGSSLRKMEFELNKLQNKRDLNEFKKIEDRKLEQRLRTLIYCLKKDGLIRKNSEGKHVLTSKGVNNLKALKEGNNISPISPILPKRNIGKNTNFIIISFDVPEAERKKRYWLRESLVNMGFKKLQQSVWIGRVKLPQEFFSGIEELRIQNYIEVFEISKKGSLRNII